MAKMINSRDDHHNMIPVNKKWAKIYLLTLVLIFAPMIHIMYIWQDGMLDPITTAGMVLEDFQILGPFALLLDAVIIYFIYRGYRRIKSSEGQDINSSRSNE